MVWAIFAPKLIFDACLHVVMTVACVSLLWGMWWREGGRKRRKEKVKIGERDIKMSVR